MWFGSRMKVRVRIFESEAMEVSILLWVSGSIYGFECGSVDIFHYLQVQFLWYMTNFFHNKFVILLRHLKIVPNDFCLWGRKY